MNTASPYNIADFSPHLFWDMDRSKMDMQQNKRLIIERVLQRGSRLDLQRLLDHYGKAGVREVVKELPWLDDKDIAFVHVFFDIPYSELKCFAKKQLSRYY